MKNEKFASKWRDFHEKLYFLKNRKNAIFHYPFCKTRSQKEVLKQKRKKKRPEMNRKRSNISFDLLQNISVWSISRRKKKCQKSNISFDLLQNTRFHRPAPPKPGWWKKQYFVWLVAKHDFLLKNIFWKMELLKKHTF